MSEEQDPALTPWNTEAAAEWVGIDTIKAWEGNPRAHGAGPMKTARSIIKFGWGAPVLARRENREAVAGHGRLQAARELIRMWAAASEKRRTFWASTPSDRGGWHPDALRVATKGEVVARMLDHLTEDMAHQLAVADNRIGEESEWRHDLLTAHFEDWKDATDITTLGFDTREIEKLEGVPMKKSKGAKMGVPSFDVIIKCRDEAHQVEILDMCEAEGWECRALI